MRTFAFTRLQKPILIWLLVISCAHAYTQQPSSVQCRPISAIKTTTPPKIDGDLSDECWKTAAKAEGFVDIATNAPGKDATTAWICYDDKNIYVAFDCQDGEPDKVTARETVRDSKFQIQQGNGSTSGPQNTEDNVEFDIDPFLTFKTQDLSQFSVNAIGTPSAQLAGGRANKAEWKGDFLVAAKRTATGWTAEMQIPWKSLNYPRSSKPVVIGVNFQRYQNRSAINYYWSDVTAQTFTDKEGQWNGVSVPGAGFKPTLSLLPYVLGAAQTSGFSLRGGLDTRYTITPELTAVGTLEPDFSTVEGAVTNIQFSRGEKFLPESRPFFLEGQNLFNPGFNFLGPGPLYYSDRIPGFDVGTKLYGKVDPTDTIGFLDTDSFGGRNDTFLRLNHDLGPTATAGIFVGDKNTPGDNNLTTSFDYHERWGKALFETRLSDTSGPTAGGGGSAVNLGYQDKYLTSVVEYADLSNRFVDEDGFVPFIGYKGFQGLFDWTAQYKSTPLRSFEVTWSPLYWWNMDGTPFYRQTDLFLTATTKKDDSATLELDYDRYNTSLDQYASLTLLHGVTNRFAQYGIQVQTGILNEAPATYISPTVSLRLFKKLDLTYTGSLLNLQGVTQQHVATANYVVSPTVSFGGRIVVQNSNTNWFLFYHNSGGKGTEYYFVIGDPNAPKFVRQALVKVVFAL